MNLTTLQFLEGLFKNADGSLATIHRELAMAKSGLFLAPPSDFDKIMEGKVVICKDEHSFLSTSKLVVPLPSEQEEILIPALDGKKRLYLIHLGKIDASETHTLSMVAHREEGSDEAWMVLKQSPVKTLLSHFEGNRLQDVWGGAWQSQGKICSIEQADLFACLCRAQPDQARAMLRQSGFTARPIYVSPKPEIKGADLPKLLC